MKTRVVDELRAIDPKLVTSAGNKLGGIKHFHSLAPQAQKHGLAIGDLRGFVNSGHYGQVDEAGVQFAELAKEIIRRTGI